MPLPISAAKKKEKQQFTYEAESEEASEPEPEAPPADPLEGVEDVDEVQDVAQEIFDAAYKDLRKKHMREPSRFPPKTHVYIRLLNEATGTKEWVPLVYGKGNKASDMAMEKVVEALTKHDFKVGYRAETAY
jgi:hypothetical protein